MGVVDGVRGPGIQGAGRVAGGVDMPAGLRGLRPDIPSRGGALVAALAARGRHVVGPRAGPGAGALAGAATVRAGTAGAHARAHGGGPSARPRDGAGPRVPRLQGVARHLLLPALAALLRLGVRRGRRLPHVGLQLPQKAACRARVPEMRSRAVQLPEVPPERVGDVDPSPGQREALGEGGAAQQAHRGRCRVDHLCRRGAPACGCARPCSARSAEQRREDVIQALEALLVDVGHHLAHSQDERRAGRPRRHGTEGVT
mmetsp:Transcript_11455/g.34391  ORF Transcript_11455/g.34391 Transcript_11455/m.34391 type:complete len:258 (-) Transcript_11455:39-812(-)